jgi:hypothetical protein
MLTEGDLLHWHEGYAERQTHWLEMLAEGLELAPEFLKGILEQNSKISGVMSKGVITVTEDMPAREVAHLMYKNNITVNAVPSCATESSWALFRVPI